MVSVAGGLYQPGLATFSILEMQYSPKHFATFSPKRVAKNINNAVERSIKPFVISRKNFLFCKTPSGAKATATVFSLIGTAKANKLDPFKYLVYIFEKLSQDENYDLEQLMPWTVAVVDACKAVACE